MGQVQGVLGQAGLGQMRPCGLKGSQAGAALWENRTQPQVTEGGSRNDAEVEGQRCWATTHASWEQKPQAPQFPRQDPQLPPAPQQGLLLKPHEGLTSPGFLRAPVCVDIKQGVSYVFRKQAPLSHQHSCFWRFAAPRGQLEASKGRRNGRFPPILPGSKGRESPR